MKLLKKYLKKEDGSATIEFLGILPLILIIVMVMWQLIVTVQAVVVAQSAANEAGKVYSLTQNKIEATNAAQKIIDAGGDYLSMTSVSASGVRNFTTKVKVKIDFVFLPKKLFGGNTPSYSFSSKASGRVIR